jgi:FlaA1/EpsC-like NDP-sugar epimerase
MPTIHAFYLRHRTLSLAAGNLSLAVVAYVLAFALRFDLSIPASFGRTMLVQLPILLLSKGVAYWCFGLYSDWWRHLSVRALVDIIKANALGSALFIVSVVLLRDVEGFPRSVFVLDFIVATALLGGIRLTVRAATEERNGPRPHRIEELALIVGAGDAGIRLFQEIEGRGRTHTAVVGFVDDDPEKIGLRVGGAMVLGAASDLPRLVAEHGISRVLVAIPSASGKEMRRIIQHCQAAGVGHKVLPSLGELVDGRVMYTQMREVKVDDLLAREPVRLEGPRIADWLRGKTVLVTGAAGSIGAELCRQIARFGPKRLILYDRNENGLFALDMELRIIFPSLNFLPVLGDVLLENQLRSVFAAERPDLVFHAAAYKHVPIAERNIIEAVRNNILGTWNVAQAALAHDVREFVLISTDKAVRPTSVMGVTKRAAEQLVDALQNGHCKFMCVRFGNVLGSAGSVIPIFREQIARGGPVTVTHPDVTRYFMTIPEATQLVLQAATIGQGGELFVLEMGEPVKIVDLARNMIRLSGFEPDEDIAIVFTGLRPGEKLFEELLADDEEITATLSHRIKILRNTNGRPAITDALGEVQRLVATGDAEGAVQLLCALVPSYSPSTTAVGRQGRAPDRHAEPAPQLRAASHS